MQHIRLPWPRLYHSQKGDLAGDHASLVVVAVKKDPHELNDHLVAGAKRKCSVAGSNRRHWTKHRSVLGPHHNQLDQPSAERVVSFLHTHRCLVLTVLLGSTGPPPGSLKESRSLLDTPSPKLVLLATWRPVLLLGHLSVSLEILCSLLSLCVGHSC